MIQLKNIVKNYVMGSNTVQALKGVSIAFRKNEFVAILGPSGGGKTTLLNIIGGLDRYTSGDLLINGKSTANFTDRDWDSYRNHSVGFVFQSYNLIPHQSVLANVELALTISGVSSRQRKQKALDALAAVGLADQVNKHPNQLSGGQMQRVAIARALVNNPDILLADEPTGALDTQSSLAIMDILKQVASDRLVVMVTHNPELAEQYANRIVRIRDGQLIDDTNPFVTEDENMTFTSGRTRMSFFTALGLSLNNLLTKRGRTILTAFAGSIGIIGIALIMALSQGVNKYIDDVQANSLSSYPLTIESNSADYTSVMGAMMGAIVSQQEVEGQISEVQMASGMFSQVGKNNLKAFNAYLKENHEKIDPLLSSIQYNYGTVLQIYKSDTSDGVIQLNPSPIFSQYSNSFYSRYSYGSSFQQMLDNQELLENQYDVIAGRWPQKYDEAILVLQSRYGISDYMVYSLGIRDPNELAEIFQKTMKGEEVIIDNEQMTFDYDYFLNLSFKVLLNSDKYRYNAEYNIYEDMSSDEQYMKDVLENSLDLKLVGIVVAKSGTSTTALQSGVAYRHDLVEYVISRSAEKEIVLKQLADRDTDVFSSRSFDDLNSNINQQGLDFSKMISVDRKALTSAFGVKVDEDKLLDAVGDYVNDALGNLRTDTSSVVSDISEAFSTLANGMLEYYIDNYGTGDVAVFSQDDISRMVDEYLQSSQAQKIINDFSDKYSISSQQTYEMFSAMLTSIANSYYNIARENGIPAAIDRNSIQDIVTGLLSDSKVVEQLQNYTSTIAQAIIRSSLSKALSNITADLPKNLGISMNVNSSKLAKAFKFNLDEQELARVMNAYMADAANRATYEDNLLKLGYADLDDPTSISLYFNDFARKDQFKQMVADYNQAMKESNRSEDVINYSDLTGILMSSVTTIINAISYVLIAFVSVSLVVSSIMIGIITYISVLERTKEIGILRSLGASKSEVGRVFSAETFIIGLISGLLGISLTVLLCYPINAIVRQATHINNITAYLPLRNAVILVVISVILTLIAGLIPSSLASRRDPVEALRSE